MTPQHLVELSGAWRTRADELERFAPPAAAAFRLAADELEEALEIAGDEELTLADAAAESGYAARTLRDHLARGLIPNAGEKHRPRIRRKDLPRRAAPAGASDGFDPDKHIAGIVGGS